MNEYISTAQFARSKESVIEHQQLIEECMKVFNDRSQNSANFKVIHSIKFLNDYTFEIRWASANPIDVLQAGRALRLFSDEMLKADGMREKIVGGKFLSYHTINAAESDPNSSNLELLEKIVNLIRTNPTDSRIEEIKKILK